MRHVVIVVLLSLVPLVRCQERFSVVVPAESPLPVPRWNEGEVMGSTYKNPSVGLELTVAPQLILGRPELKGKTGMVPLLVTVAAWSEENGFSARQGTIFYADALAYYPDDQRSTEAYMRKIVRGNKAQGFDPVSVGKDDRVGGVSFARTDFKKGEVYEAVFVKACHAQALVFVFAGSDPEIVRRLIATTGLKLNLQSSGCGPRSGKQR